MKPQGKRSKTSESYMGTRISPSRRSLSHVTSASSGLSCTPRYFPCSTFGYLKKLSVMITFPFGESESQPDNRETLSLFEVHVDGRRSPDYNRTRLAWLPTVAHPPSHGNRLDEDSAEG